MPRRRLRSRLRRRWPNRVARRPSISVATDESNRRVVSGMRPTGALHLGHYHGVLSTWLRLQQQYECLFFVADWHALTTMYEDPESIREHVPQMVIDWLAVGIDPGLARLFVQSRVPEHAELQLLLGMMTPLSWLERVPSYKDALAEAGDRELSTFGFLGYPLLQTADIIVYKAGHVPVGEDQKAHVELARELARRFNDLYGGEEDFVEKARASIERLGKKNAKLYARLREAYQQRGDEEALQQAQSLVHAQQGISIGDRERLLGYLKGNHRILFPEPEALLAETPRIPGLDGRKMSKSYGNTILLRDPADTVQKKLKTMPTDPARVRRSDPGDPDKCPVWGLHEVYSSAEVQQWAQQGCRSAAIGCLECKGKLIDRVQETLEPIRARRAELEGDVDVVWDILSEGAEAAGAIARDTLQEVCRAMGLQYR